MSVKSRAHDAGSGVLHIRVGESLADAGARAASVMKALQRGEAVAPYFGVGFAEVGRLLAIFTPKRWAMIAALREHGPATVAELARRVGRNYKNVHTDVAQQIEWMAVTRLADGTVAMPWSEIIVDMKLPDRRAA